MPLPKEKTKVKENLGEYSILVYGQTKLGKTTLASKFPDAFFMATEKGLNSLEVYCDYVKTWDEILANAKEFAAGKHKFKTMVIDTIDNAYKLCSEFICEKLKVKHESEVPFGKGFAMVNSEFQRVLTRLSQLPYGLIFISHAQEKEFEQRNGSKVKKIIPTLSKGAREIVLGMVDIILYVEMINIKDEEGKKIIGTKRVIRTKPTNFYEAGDRTNRLPDTLDLNYDKLVEAFKVGNPDQQEISLDD